MSQNPNNLPVPAVTGEVLPAPIENQTFLKKKYVEKAIYDISIDNQFYSGLLQEINIGYSNFFPTACLMYDKKKDEFNISVNFDYFHSLTSQQRSAVLFHEILHFSHQHLMRAEQFGSKPEDRMLFNIAADMAINQYIQNLPEGSIDVAKFNMKDGKPFPRYQNFETYLQLLKQTTSKPYGGQDGENDGDGTNDGQMQKIMGPPGDQPGDGSGKFDGPTDSHMWSDLTEDEKQRMLKEAAKVIKRTIDKTSHSHSLCPDSIKDLLEEIENQIQAINYKKILAETIKKTLCIADRTNTWKRPNKRYGNYAPGTRVGNLPRIAIYIDTSGSISHNELNQFLQVMDGFLKVGAKTCTLGLWNTALYKKIKYKKAQDFQPDWIESGGTDLTEVMEDIKKNKPDLSIILTDGYYSDVNIQLKEQIVWVIGENLNTDHPLKRFGKTVLLKGVI